jgi:hypothetical protein
MRIPNLFTDLKNNIPKKIYSINCRLVGALFMTQFFSEKSLKNFSKLIKIIEHMKTTKNPSTPFVKIGTHRDYIIINIDNYQLSLVSNEKLTEKNI